jgi:nucleotide-binding universal stress UspA family protein
MLEPQKNPKPIKRIVAMEQKAMIASRPFSHIVESLSIIPELERIDYVVEIAKRSNLLLNLVGFLDARLIKKNTSKWIKLALERRRLHLKDLPKHIKLVMHGASSMPEFKTRIIAERNKAELIVMRAPLKKSSSINRLIFQDSFRSLIQDIPCNLLILRNK